MIDSQPSQPSQPRKPPPPKAACNLAVAVCVCVYTMSDIDDEPVNYALHEAAESGDSVAIKQLLDAEEEDDYDPGTVVLTRHKTHMDDSLTNNTVLAFVRCRTCWSRGDFCERARS